MTIEEDLTKIDFEWISDFEKAVVRACFECGLLSAARKTGNSQSLSEVTQIDSKLLDAVLPVIQNADLQNVEQPPIPNRPSIVKRLIEMFKGGTGLLTGQRLSEMWTKGEIDYESAKKFSASMYRTSLLGARIHCKTQPFKELRRIVDLGGGGGAWAVEALATHPHLEYTIFDLDNVCKATHENLQEYAPAVCNRITYVVGSFFVDSLPESDGYLLSNILHDWPLSTCEHLLAHIHRSIPGGVELYLNECLLNEDKTGPRFVSLLNLLMLLNYSSQQFTQSEIAALLIHNNFGPPRVASTAAHYSLLVSTS